ncbi:MAG: suppressor of fused domain protein [Chitinophagaceae bacterium]|nr:suppressor of fused domain protein [Chitinophagaceae bacterium]
MNFFKKLFGRKDDKKAYIEEFEKHDHLKMEGLERVLGPSHDMVGHALIPFDIGGAVDMYYFPNGIAGTGFATMELIKPDGTGPIPNSLGTYEFVAFTRHEYVQDAPETAPFTLMQSRLCGIFTTMGNYSFEAKLKPGDTCEVPGSEDEPNMFVILDEYRPDNLEFRIGDNKHGLLLIMEVFREEMEYARENGSAALFARLKEKGRYPYSDMDRASVL